MSEQMRRRYYFSVVFAGLVAIFGAGHGSMFMPSLVMPQNSYRMSETSSHCQSVCPLQAKEDGPNVQAKDEDDEPAPIPFVAGLSPLYTNSMYVLAISVLALAFLRRGPPDLLASYGILRI